MAEIQVLLAKNMRLLKVRPYVFSEVTKDVRIWHQKGQRVCLISIQTRNSGIVVEKVLALQVKKNVF